MDKTLFNIFDLPVILAIFMGLILASVLVITRAATRRNYFLAFYLYAISLIELEKIIFWSVPLHKIFEVWIPVIFALEKCVGLLVPTLLYLYMEASNALKMSSVFVRCLLLTSSFLGLLIVVWIFQSLGSNEQIYDLSNYHYIFFHPSFIFFLWCKYGLVFGLVIICIREKINLDDEAYIVIAGAAIIYLFEFMTDSLALMAIYRPLVSILGVTHNCLVFIYFCIILAYILKQYYIRKYRRSKVYSEAAKRLMNSEIKRISSKMVENQYYLDPGIDLQSLAKKLNIADYQLSNLLNNSFHMTFPEFINYYRIEHAKAIIVKDINKKQTIIEIMYESGFSSKSAFNRNFKKFMGVTPSEFRRNAPLE